MTSPDGPDHEPCPTAGPAEPHPSALRRFLATWRVALRLARREAARSKGRSLLVLAMLALPVLTVTAADVTLRTGESSESERLAQELGFADARFQRGGLGGPIEQAPTTPETRPGRRSPSAPPFVSPWRYPPISEVLPDGGRAVEVLSREARATTPQGRQNVTLIEVDTTDMLGASSFRIRGGRTPNRPDEVMVSASFLEAGGLGLGSTIRVGGADGPRYTVTGSLETRIDLHRRLLVGLPGAVTRPLAADEEKRFGRSVTLSRHWLVTAPGGVRWKDVLRANRAGYQVESRRVLAAPPPRGSVPYYQGGLHRSEGPGTATRFGWYLGSATGVGLALLQVVLLAGPAFAVGARRSRRLLALMAVSGADRRQLRAVVLAGGALLGTVGAALGVGGGIGLAMLVRPWLEELLGHRFGAWDLRFGELALIGSVGIAAGLLAAVVPAVSASRHTVVHALTGRIGARRGGRTLPTTGVLAVLLGAGTAVAGAVCGHGGVVVLGGAAVAELGLISCLPTLLARLGRICGGLPAAPRLALREAVRSRSRTVPAVAAVMAAVAAATALAVHSAGAAEADRVRHVAAVAPGRITLTFDGRTAHGPPPDGSSANRTSPNRTSRRGAANDATGANDANDATAQQEAAAIVAASKRAVAAGLPVTDRVDLRYAVPKLPPQDAAPGVPAAARTASSAAAPGAVNVARPSRDVCPFRRAGTRPERWNAAERRALRTDRRCARERLGAGSKSLLPYGQTVAVGDADTVTALLGHRDPKAASAMAAGRAVLLDPGYADGGRARLRLYRADPAFADQLPTADREINVPIHLARPDPQRELRNGVVLVLPERMLGRLGLRAQDAGAIWTAAQQPGPGSWRHVEEQLAQISPDRPAELQLERGPGGHDAAPSPTLPFTVPAGLLAIGAAGIATGLAAAESHRDMAVLAAVGAPGRLRRKVAAYQCGFLALLGAVLGSLAGLVPAIGVISANRYLAARDPTGPLWPEPHPVVVPWVDVSVLLVAVPLLAALLAGALTRSLPTRRNRRATGP